MLARNDETLHIISRGNPPGPIRAILNSTQMHLCVDVYTIFSVSLFHLLLRYVILALRLHKYLRNFISLIWLLSLFHAIKISHRNWIATLVTAEEFRTTYEYVFWMKICRFERAAPQLRRIRRFHFAILGATLRRSSKMYRARIGNGKLCK